MAITTVNQKLSLVEAQVWTPGLPISPSSLGTDDKLQMLHAYPFTVSTLAEGTIRGIGRALGRGLGRSF